MNLTEVRKLTNGERVRCKLNCEIEMRNWFTGTIEDSDNDGDCQNIIIKRDLEGVNWQVYVNNGNCEYIDLLEWDSENNEI